MSNIKPLVSVFILAMHLPTACMRSPDCFQPEVFCAALVTDTNGIHDHGLNQDAWSGLEQSRSDGWIDQLDFIESVDGRDQEKNIRFFAEKGYDVIVTAGRSLRDETIQAAVLYPDILFVGMDQPGEEARGNLLPVIFPEDQMGFMAGALAARLTGTGTVGAVCETSEIDSMWRYCEGFRAGALFVNNAVQALVEYRENRDPEKQFLDEAWGRARARDLMARGADVIFAAGGVTGQGALAAACEAGLAAVGAERDQAAALGQEGNCLATSIYGRASFEVQRQIRSLRQGRADPQRIGQFGYVPLPEKYRETLGNDLDSLLVGLLSREIATKVTNERP